MNKGVVWNFEEEIVHLLNEKGLSSKKVSEIIAPKAKIQPESVRAWISRQYRVFEGHWVRRSELKLVGEERDKNDVVTKSRYALRTTDHNVDYSKMEVVGSTVNPYGPDYVKYAPKSVDYFDVRDELVEQMKKHAPKYPKIRRNKSKDPHLLVVTQADLHVGKYHENYNMEEAKRRAKMGVEKIIKRTAGVEIDKILYVGGNDKLHTADGKYTKKGTPQDTDGLWWEHFQVAKEIDVFTVEALLTVADVHYVHVMSNHDYQNGMFLADSISSWFRKSKNFTCDVSPKYRKYVLYGSSLIGLSHGDGAKETQLPDLMKTEASMAWSKARFGYWYLGHVHHKDRSAMKGQKKQRLEKDYMDVAVIHNGKDVDPFDKCFVEYLRSMGGSDEWHHFAGFEHSPASMEAFLHHPTYGQTDRWSVFF